MKWDGTQEHKVQNLKPNLRKTFVQKKFNYPFFLIAKQKGSF